MKIFDKFLKFLKTDRNTFFTYIFTLLTAFIIVDRVAEMLIMVFTGMSVSYWGPFAYTFALACPVLAFLFSGNSKFIKSDDIKITYFNTYVVSFYIVAISMFTQWLNMLGWSLFLSVPNYVDIVENFSYLIKPAFTAISLYLPLVTFYPILKWLLLTVNSTKLIKDSIKDYGGIDLSGKKASSGPYNCSIYFGTDKETGSKVTLLEDRRFEHLLVSGVTGMGKTSLIVEPMIAKDLDKKSFFRSVAKELGLAALRNGNATLNSPYTNDYLNSHFNLNMISTSSSSSDSYDKLMGKMLISNSAGRYTYRDLGLTYMNPDIDSINKMIAVASSYGIPYNIIDPSNSSSIGLNPFVYDEPTEVAVAISTMIKKLIANNQEGYQIATAEKESAFQALENVCILLKEMYPRVHNDSLANLQDVLDYLSDFTLVEQMCNVMKDDEELSERYSNLLKYFSRNFYAKSKGYDTMQANLENIIAELESLLRYPGVKQILCNRSYNLNYDEALANGDITFVCTRQGDLGPTIHKIFGLYFLLYMQFAVLRRPGNEKTRVPHFLYIDGFGTYVGSITDPIFEVYRKYKVGAVITIQGLSQLGPTDSARRKNILANCANKITFGNNSEEDVRYWNFDLGTKIEFQFKEDYDTEKGEYSAKKSGIEYKYPQKFSTGKIQNLPFKQCFYKFRKDNGRNDVGVLKLDFLAPSYTAPKKLKEYDFGKFSGDSLNTKGENLEAQEQKSSLSKHRAIRKNFHFKDDLPGEVNPVQTDVTGSNFPIDTQDAVVDKRKKKS